MSTIQSPLDEFWTEVDEACDRIVGCFGEGSRFVDGPEKIDFIYREFHSLKGTAMLFDAHQVATVAHTLESALEDVRAGQKALTERHVDLIFLGVGAIEALMSGARAGQPSESLGAEVAKVLEFNLALSGGAMTVTKDNMSIADHSSDKATPEVERSLAKAGTKPAAAAADEHSESSSTIRVPVGLLDRLMTLMGEMVLVRNQVIQYSSKSDDLEFLNLSQRLDVVTSEIQSEMMKTRMQPIGNVLSKFQRLVRDLGRDLNKKIDLHLFGTETELDKTLLESVKDPLTHIIRNACDHGLETPSERAAAGKPEMGTISVKAFHEGGQVIIEIGDDGRGLHKENLISKAIEKGLLTRESAAALTEREVFNIIFLPGFSTAQKVTNISGRGVGMDVVRSNIDKIGGLVEIQSQQGQGTTIRLKIPLTLAIVPAMIVSCDKDLYAIPQLKLVELLRVPTAENSPIENLQGKSILHLRGNLLPLLDLKTFLGFHEGQESPPLPDVVNIVVLRGEGQLFGLIVDEIQDTADIVVKPLSGFLKRLNFYSGATVLGNGSVALILDVMGLAQKMLAVDSNKAHEEKAEVHEMHDRFVSQDMQEFLLFRLNAASKHAIPLDLVHRLEEFMAKDIEVSGGQRVMRYRDSILPIINLDEYFGYGPRKSDTSSGVVSVIVTRKDNRYYGIEVDEILDVLKTPAEVDESLTDRPGLLGSLISGQEVIVAVDSMQVLEEFAKKSPNYHRPEAKHKRANQQIRGNGLQLLYAEDNAFFRRHVASILTRAGFQVKLVNNGAEAIAELESAGAARYAAVLSDIEMPKMNGLQFAQQVRKNGNFSRLPLIALTTKYEPQQVEEGLAAGFDIYLEKLNGEELIETIGKLQLSKAG